MKRRKRMLLAAAVLPLAGFLAGWLLSAPRAGLIFLIGAERAVATGDRGARVSAVFRFKSTASVPVSPRVVWTNCGCNEYEFSPAVVPPGGEFSLRVGGSVPLWAPNTLQLFRVAAESNPDPASGVLVVFDILPSVEKELVLATDQVRWSREGDTGGTFLMDIAYSGPGATGTLHEDLRVEVENAQVTGIVAVGADGRHDGGYAGQVAVTFTKAQDVAEPTMGRVRPTFGNSAGVSFSLRPHE